MGVSRLVIDSIMPIALLFSDDDERKKGFLKLMNNIRKWKTTTMIIAEELPASGTLPRTTYGIETLSDGWIHVDYRIGKNDERMRGIEVLKMKGANPIMKRFQMEITDSGINVMTK